MKCSNPADRPNRSRDWRDAFRLDFLSPRTWAAVLTLAVFYLLLADLGAPSEAEKQQLRTQFHLPEDVPLSKVYVDRSSNKTFPAPIEGIARFGDAQFSDYVARLDQEAIWKPLPISHGGTEFQGPYAPSALLWRDLSSAYQLAWGRLSWKQAQAAQKGRVMCFSLRQGESAVACAAGYTSRTPTVHVQGLLDFDTRTLHMVIRQSRS